VADLDALVLDARLRGFRLHRDVVTLSTSSEAAPTKGAIPMASFSNYAAIVKASAWCDISRERRRRPLPFVLATEAVARRRRLVGLVRRFRQRIRQAAMVLIRDCLLPSRDRSQVRSSKNKLVQGGGGQWLDKDGKGSAD
jgi:hypothetical protein